jgi:hypothetical protein
MFLAAATEPSTTLPTWLVVAVPVLAALISGSAGMLGALLGGRAARGTAERTAGLAQQDEQRRWNREQRKQAYLAFLEARNRLVAARGRAQRRLIDEDPRRLPEQPDDIRADQAAQEAALEALFGAALPEVELFGSSQAAAAAERWAHFLSLRKYSEDLVEQGLLPDEPGGHGYLDERQNHRGPFLELIRRELGVDV